MRDVHEIWHRYGCMLIGLSDVQVYFHRTDIREPLTLRCCGGLVFGRRFPPSTADLISPMVSPVALDQRTTPPLVLNIVDPVALVYATMLPADAEHYYHLLLKAIHGRPNEDRLTIRALNEVFAVIDARLGHQYLTEHLDDGDELFREAYIEKELPR